MRRACTGLVKVAGPEGDSTGHIPDSEVDSLNVSVATGILLHQLLQSASLASAARDQDLSRVADSRESVASKSSAALE